MKIKVIGKQEVTSKKSGEVFTKVYAIVTEPDKKDEKLNGNKTFDGFFKWDKARIDLNDVCEVIFEMFEGFDGKYTARPCGLVKLEGKA